MNYGGDAADQIVRYSMEGMEHTLRISGSIAKNLAVLIVAVMKDQKKTRGKTNLLRMLKEQRAMKFFTITHDRLREFAGEAKSRGLLYVVIRDKKNPKSAEIMVFADDAATVLMVDTNIQRENLLPSEKARAYKMKYEALKHQGSKGDKHTADVVGEKAGDSGRTVQKKQ